VQLGTWSAGKSASLAAKFVLPSTIVARAPRRYLRGMTFNDRTSPLSLLRTRRSGKPRDLIAPGPSDAQLLEMVAIASRTPDHGKLFPWRFVIVPSEARDTLAASMAAILAREKADSGPRDLEAAEQFARQAPALVVVLSSPVHGHKVPLWEQELSAGAAAMNLLHAAHALGFAGGWLTGWAAYSDAVRDLFGRAPERIAGFVFIGTPGRELEERPRPSLSDIAQFWGDGAGRIV
jgi:nitroreductase